MQKPLLVLRQDFVNDAVTLVNKYGQSGLPMFAIYDVLNDIMKEVQKNSQAQYQSALSEYEKAEAEEKAKAKEKK